MNRLSQLAQMSHLDLLAAYFTGTADGRRPDYSTRKPDAEERYLHRMSRDALIAAVLAQENSHTTAAEVHPQ